MPKPTFGPYAQSRVKGNITSLPFDGYWREVNHGLKFLNEPEASNKEVVEFFGTHTSPRLAAVKISIARKEKLEGG